MIEKPKRPKKIPNQDNKQPQTIQELIRRYDLDNTKIYDFLDELTGHLKKTQTVVSATEPTGDNREKVWIQKGKNLLNPKNIVFGGIPVNSTSEVLDVAPEGLVTEWISCQPNTTYILSVYGTSEGFRSRWQTKAEDGTITFISTKGTATTNSTAKYMRVYYYYGYDGITLPNAQIEQGSTATAYEEYINHKIYVKNDNDVYEEFTSKSEYVAVNYNDYIEYNENVTTVNSTTVYRKDNVVFINFDLIGNFSEGETVIGTLKKKLKFGTLGAARMGDYRLGATAAKPATIIMLSNGPVRIYAVSAGIQTAGTVILLLDE